MESWIAFPLLYCLSAVILPTVDTTYNQATCSHTCPSLGCPLYRVRASNITCYVDLRSQIAGKIAGFAVKHYYGTSRSITCGKVPEVTSEQDLSSTSPAGHRTSDNQQQQIFYTSGRNISILDVADRSFKEIITCKLSLKNDIMFTTYMKKGKKFLITDSVSIFNAGCYSRMERISKEKGCDSMAVDESINLVFYSIRKFLSLSVKVMSTSGKRAKMIYEPGTLSVKIAVDPQHRRLYLCMYTQIVDMDYRGGNVAIIAKKEGGAGILHDPHHNRLYYKYTNKGSLWVLDFMKGLQNDTHLTSENIHEMTLCGDILYFNQEKTKELMMCSLVDKYCAHVGILKFKGATLGSMC